MLTKFEVENFKNFRDKITVDLTYNGEYNFNEEVISYQNNCITKGIFFGINGSGKSNLGLAMLDIVSHLTGYQVQYERYSQYLNLDSGKDVAAFSYTFCFDEHVLRYVYKKKDLYKLVSEEVFIDDVNLIHFDYANNTGFSKLEGTEDLRLISNRQLKNPISMVSFLLNNSLVENEINHVFYRFGDFVRHMLLFYSLDNRGYQGLKFGKELLTQGILENSSLEEFELFLNEAGLDYKLIEKNIDGERQIYCHYNETDVNLFVLASTGTASLILLYYWYVHMSHCSLVFIDEFDAFYHFKLAQLIVRKLCKFKDTQIFLTSHNTSLLSNNLLRPDCYFEIVNSSVVSFSQATSKELRKAHNLEKMYKAGAFS